MPDFCVIFGQTVQTFRHFPGSGRLGVDHLSAIQRQNSCTLGQSSVVEETCLLWVRELKLGGSELSSSTQVQWLGVGLKHGKAGLEAGLRY